MHGTDQLSGGMAKAEVDDLLADLLALEEETFGPQDTAEQAHFTDDLLAGEPASGAAAAAADAALLADCDALLADVDLLLADPAEAHLPGAAGAAAPNKKQSAAGAGGAAAGVATAAVLSECDALLADADLLLADTELPASPPAAAAAFTREAARPRATEASSTATTTPAAAAAAGSVLAVSHAAPGTTKETPSLASETAAPAAPAPGATEPAADTHPAGHLTPAAAAAEPPPVAHKQQATPGSQQQPDVDQLLLDLLSPQDAAASKAAAGVTSAGPKSVASSIQDSTSSAVGAGAAVPSPAAKACQEQHEQAHVQQQQLQQDWPLQQSHQQQAQQPQQPQQHVSASSSASAGSDSEDFLGDMLHDMAEVLEVDESSLATDDQHQTGATPPPPPAAAGGGGFSTHAPTAGLHAAAAAAAGAAAGVSQQHLLWGGQAHTASHLDWPGLSPVMVGEGAAGGDAGGGVLPAHELALQHAWAEEEALVHGDISDSTEAEAEDATAEAEAAAGTALGSPNNKEQQLQQQQQQRRKRRRLAPLPRLQELLSDALSDWNPAGRPDASGTAMIGGSVLLSLESLAGLFASGAAAAGAGAAGVDWAQVLASAMAPHGQLQAVAASGQYLAVGTASGSTLVFQLPVPHQGPAGQPGQGSAGAQNPAHAHSTGPGHSSLPGGAAMWQLGGQSGGERGVLGFDPVSSLGFSVVGGAADALWLAVGHVSGALTVWELQKRGPRQVAGIAQHGSRLTFTTFMPGRGTGWLLSGDVRGRCCLHTFSASLLRTSVASRVLIGGEYGPLLSISHLAPFSVQRASLPDAVVGGSRGGAGAGAAGGQWPDASAWRVLCEDGAWRVGEGVCCLTTPTHAYIARLKPSSGDLVMLFSIPQPHPGAQQQAVPVAAWLPHSRQKTPSHSRLSGDMLMPVGVLALGWGSRLVLFDVPLLGDQVTAGEAVAVASAAASAAAAAQQAKRSHAPAAVAAAAAARLWQQHAHASLEGLSPEAAIAVATQFPLSTCASWAGGQGGSAPTQSSSGPVHDLQQHQMQMGPTEPLPILGLHWLDADAVAVVCNQGFSSLLLVLGLSQSRGTGGSSEDARGGKQQQAAAAGFSPSASLRVYEQVEWMDQPVDRDWGSAGVGAGGLTAWGADCGGSVVGSGARMYLLGQQGGLFCGRLMPWSERLKTLQDVRKYKLGLYFALRFYLAMQQQQESGTQDTATPQHAQSAVSSSRAHGLTPRQSMGGFARSEGIGAEPQQLEQWLLSLVLGHATATLQEAAPLAAAAAAAKQRSTVNGNTHGLNTSTADHSSSSSSSEVSAAVVAAAETCVCACLLLSRTDVLFGRVFPLFAQQVAVPGALGAFIEVVELAVLSELLQGLAPEVMQALVEHFAGKGQPGRVEACVVHLSIMSLDLNQVIRLCEGSSLYSALTYIYNQINDYRKPLLDLLANVAAAPSWQAAERAAYKLLVYLRCCFKGMAFPPGTGSLPWEPPGVRDVIQATLLGSLLFLDRADLLREWQQSGGAAAAVAAAAAAQAGSTEQAAGGPLLVALCDPHPALQLLLAVDVPATITVLAEATAGWDAVETDLRTAAGKPTTELESVLVATQVVVNALVTLLEAGRFQQWQAHRPPQIHSGSSSSADGNVKVGGAISNAAAAAAQPGADVAMSYIIQLLSAGRVNAKPSFVIKLLQHLVAQATAAAAAAAGGAPQDAASVAAVTAPFEQQFIAIVQVVGIDTTAGQPQQQQQQQLGVVRDVSALNAAQAKEVLQLAKRCRFIRAAAAVHHLQGNYAAALSCYLALAEQEEAGNSKQQKLQVHQQPQQLAAAAAIRGRLQNRRAVFDYINSFLQQGGSAGAQAHQAFLSCVRQQVVQLIQLDPDATAAVLLQHMPEQQVPVLLSIKADPELQFQFLRAAMQQNQRAQRQSGSGSLSSSAAAAGPESLLERPEVAILYVKLLARFEPSAVLPFLQSHHNYSVAEAIQVCRAAGVRDAEAFLHERLGDLDAALRLYMSTAQQANSTLQAAVLGGKLPLLLLGHGYCCQEDDSTGTFNTAGGRQSITHTTAADQECWGMGQLVAQLDALSRSATTAAAAAGTATTAGVSDAGGANAYYHTASDQLLTAAARVASTLLHQLDPDAHHNRSSSSSSRKQDRSAALPQQLQPPPPQPPGGSSSSSCSTSTPAAGRTAPQQQQQQLPPPVVDLYKAWMSELSPRLKIKGLGSAVAPAAAGAVGLTHGAGPSTCGGGNSGSSSSGVSAAAQVQLQLPPVPQELLAAWQALQAAVAFCQRNTRVSTTGSSMGSTTAAVTAATGGGGDGDGSSSSAAGDGQQLWFSLMDVYVASLRALHASRQQQQQQQQGSQEEHNQHHQQQAQGHQQQQQQQQVVIISDLICVASKQLPLQDVPGVLRAAAAAVAAQEVLPGLLRLLLDEVVCVMADHLPLLDIVGRVIQQHGSERFGEFRSTLLGLFGATRYDSAIMAAANRLITGDAFAAVRHAYGMRQLARALHEEQQLAAAAGGGGGGVQAPDASASSSNAAPLLPSVAAAAAVSGGSLLPGGAVQSAKLLGVLGAGTYNSSSSSSGSISSRYSLSQADRDLLQGILGAGGMRLQLQPAGGRGQLTGVAGEYKAAAQAVADSGRVFQGEMDLALEMAMLQSLQEHQQHGPGGGGPSWHSPARDGVAAAVAGMLGQQQQHSGQVLADDGAASGGRPPASTGSFDIDDLLSWSHTNM